MNAYKISITSKNPDEEKKKVELELVDDMKKKIISMGGILQEQFEDVELRKLRLMMNFFPKLFVLNGLKHFSIINFLSCHVNITRTNYIFGSLYRFPKGDIIMKEARKILFQSGLNHSLIILAIKFQRILSNIVKMKAVLLFQKILFQRKFFPNEI